MLICVNRNCWAKVSYPYPSNTFYLQELFGYFWHKIVGPFWVLGLFINSLLAEYTAHSVQTLAEK